MANEIAFGDPNRPQMPRPGVPRPGAPVRPGGFGNTGPMKPGVPPMAPPQAKPMPKPVSSHGPGSGAPPTARPMPRPAGPPVAPPRLPMGGAVSHGPGSGAPPTARPVPPKPRMATPGGPKLMPKPAPRVVTPPGRVNLPPPPPVSAPPMLPPDVATPPGGPMPPPDYFLPEDPSGGRGFIPPEMSQPEGKVFGDNFKQDMGAGAGAPIGFDPNGSPVPPGALGRGWGGGLFQQLMNRRQMQPQGGWGGAAGSVIDRMRGLWGGGGY